MRTSFIDCNMQLDFRITFVSQTKLTLG